MSTPDLHEVVARRVAAAGAPGAAYVIIRNGRTEAHAVGYASQAERTPLRPDMPLALGSVSKPFTAVAVLQLVDRGLIELDAPISRYLPWLRFADARAADRITVRQLLTHTSGISTYTGNQSQTDRSMDAGALRRRVEALASVSPGPSGAAWAYSNSNYQILGVLIETLSGQSYPDYVRTRIFEPLGMRNSFVLVPPPGLKPAVGHRRWFGILRPVEGQTLGAGSAPQGGVYASAEDIGKFITAFLGKQSPLLSPQMRAIMLKPQPGVPKQGLGWRVSAGSRPGFIWHGGDSPGYAAFVGFDPKTGTGLGIMTNLGLNLVAAPAHGVTDGTASELFGLPPVPAASSPVEIGIVAFVGVSTLAAMSHAVRLWIRRNHAVTQQRSRLRRAMSIAVAVLLVVLGIVVLQLPRLLFGASIAAAWVFMPDMILLLLACAAAMVLAGSLHLVQALKRPPTITG